MHIEWHEQPRASKGDEATSWLIDKMTFEDFDLYESERPLFSDVAYEALGESDWSRLLPSVDERMMLDLVLEVRTGITTIEENLEKQRERPLDGVSQEATHYL